MYISRYRGAQASLVDGNRCLSFSRARLHELPPTKTTPANLNPPTARIQFLSQSVKRRVYMFSGKQAVS